MIKFNRVLVIAAFAFAPLSFVHAASTAAVNITSVSVGGSGDVFIKTDGSFLPTSGCTNTAKYLLPKSHAAKKELLAVLLTAQASDKSVKIATAASCGQVGAITYTQAVNIEVTN